MKIINRDPKKLIAAEYNPRKLSSEQFEQIKSSLQRFGFVDPVIVNKHPDRMDIIIGGHQRVKVATVLGFETVPTVELNIDEAQERELNIRLNKNTGEFDWDVLRDQFEKSDLGDWGFTAEELEAFDVEDVTEGLTDEDDVPEPPKEPVTVEGDVWILGKHRLMCGDSTSIDHLEKLCEGGLVDMWLTDPPYNVALGFDETPEQAKKRNRRTDGLVVKNDKMDNDSFRQFLCDAYSAADAVMKAGAVFYIWHADSEGYNFRGAASDIGWKVRQCLIWRKSSLVMGRQDYHWMHEPCLYGWKEGAAHLWSSDRKQTTIFDFVKPSRNGEHPTMKPVELFEYQMLNNTKGSDLVLDSFAGSGTTAIACEKHGRIARMMELDPKYCDVIIKRWQDFTGQQATLEADGRKFDEVKK